MTNTPGSSAEDSRRAAVPGSGALTRLAQDLGTARDMLSVLRALRVYCEGLTGSSGLFVSLLDAERLRHCVYGWADGAELDVSALPPLPLTSSSPHARAILTGEAVVEDNLQAVMATIPNVAVGYERDPRPVQVSIALPLAVLGRVIGGFEIQLIHHADPWAAVPELRVAANLAAAAIENVRLVEAERAQRQAAEASEQRSRSSEERLRLALEATGLGTAEWELESGQLRCSPSTERLFGRPASELPRSWSELLELIHADDRADVERTLGLATARPGTWEVEYRVVWADGSLHWLACRAHVVAEAAGSRGRVIATLLEITDRKEAEQQREAWARADRLRAQQLAALNRQLRVANQAEHQARADAEAAVRMRDEFLSVAAHELRTPITRLLGNAQLLLRRAQRGEAMLGTGLVERVRLLELEAVKLAQLVSHLLDLSRLEFGKLGLQRSVTDLAALVEGVVASLAVDPIRYPIVVRTSGRPLAAVDPLRIEQVVTNLLDNAVRFSPNGGRIEVDITSVGKDWVRLAVRDHGIGIPAEHRARLFERFYQAHEREYRSGLGLGLYITRQIVEQHGGRIEAEFLHDGTRFVVTLPTELEAHPPQPEPSNQLPSPS